MAKTFRYKAACNLTPLSGGPFRGCPPRAGTQLLKHKFTTMLFVRQEDALGGGRGIFGR